MARIRSTHPGQWTDEAFATLSPLAHLLAIGVRNEADDGGVFEWRPLQLKMRLLPMYPCDVVELLAELTANDVVRQYEVGGKAYGAIRNFCRYQSPDKPRQVYPRVEWVDDYTAKRRSEVAEKSDTGSGGVDDQSDTAPSRIGRDRKGKEGSKTTPPESGAYRWAGSIIRLKQADYAKWAAAFHSLDLDAHLLTQDQWLASDDATPDQRRRWFFVVSGSLRKRHEAALSEQRSAVKNCIADGYGYVPH